MIIEHRPRLQSANFFLQFSGEIGAHERIDVVLKGSSVTILKKKKKKKTRDQQREDEGDNQVGHSKEATVSNSSSNDDSSSGGGGAGLVVSTVGHLDVLTNSLSALVARDGYLSFRVNTNNSNGFGVELLQHGACDRLHEFQKVQPNIAANQEYVIKCCNCTRALGRARWAGIFELPSGNFEAGDWFCHDTIKVDISSPKRGELFYGYYYAVMNAAVLDVAKVMLKKRLVYCRRCLQFLGEQMTEGSGEGGGGDTETAEVARGIKFWNESVVVVVENADEEEEGGNRLILKSVSLMGDFQNLIRKIVHDFEYVDRWTSLLPTMHKILVKSYRTESSRDVPHTYLLMQVMEMNLEMLQWEATTQGEEGALKKQRAMKLLYCFVDASLNRDDQMLKYWTHDQNVHPLQVSPRMFDAVLECLKENSRMIPDVYRYSYGFALSYIFVEEHLE